MAAICLALVMMGMGEFCFASLTDATQTDRHLFLFHALTDLSFLLCHSRSARVPPGLQETVGLARLELCLKRARNLAEGLQCGRFRAVDLEKVDDAGQHQQGLYPLMNVDQFHLATRLPHNAVAAG